MSAWFGPVLWTVPDAVLVNVPPPWIPPCQLSCQVPELVTSAPWSRVTPVPAPWTTAPPAGTENPSPRIVNPLGRSKVPVTVNAPGLVSTVPDTLASPAPNAHCTPKLSNSPLIATTPPPVTSWTPCHWVTPLTLPMFNCAPGATWYVFACITPGDERARAPVSTSMVPRCSGAR